MSASRVGTEVRWPRCRGLDAIDWHRWSRERVEQWHASLAPDHRGQPVLIRQWRGQVETLTPAEVREALRYLGNQNWKTSTDPDQTHEPLLDVSRIGNLGTFSLVPATWSSPDVEAGTTATAIPTGPTPCSPRRMPQASAGPGR